MGTWNKVKTNSSGSRYEGWPSELVIEAAQRGDTAALEVLVLASSSHVQRFARSLCADPRDAEDAAQETLIALYQHVGGLRAAKALASWTYRIVRNECLRRARHLSRRDTGTVLEPAVRSAEDDVLAALEADRVVAALKTLPPDLQQVLIMRDVQKMPGRAVADALALSSPAMKSRLHRARAALREQLTD